MPYNEAPLSANFRLYPPNGGEPVQFTVRGEEQSKFTAEIALLVGRLEGLGYTPAPTDTKAQRRQNIEGVVLGEYIDSQTKEVKPRFHFYGTGNSKWKVGDVYPESFNIIPEWVKQAVRAAKPRPQQSAPDKERAIQLGVYVKLANPLSVVQQMRVNQNNEPILTESGKPTYKIVSFVEGQSSEVAQGPVAPSKPSGHTVEADPDDELPF